MKVYRAKYPGGEPLNLSEYPRVSLSSLGNQVPSNPQVPFLQSGEGEAIWGGSGEGRRQSGEGRRQSGEGVGRGGGNLGMEWGGEEAIWGGEGEI